MAKRGRPPKIRNEQEQFIPCWLHSLKAAKLFTSQTEYELALASGEWAEEYDDLLPKENKE